MKAKISSLSIVLLISVLLSGSANASTLRTFTLDYTAKQSEARALFDKMNEWRTSGEAWYWSSDNTTKVECGVLKEFTYDYGLEQYAIQRAYECAISFSHTRPTGEEAYNGVHAYAENIAAGHATADGCFIQFQENGKDFEGQGHRRLMLNNLYTHVGIGCVKYEGQTYWAVDFGYKSTNTPACAPVDGPVKGDVTVNPDEAVTYLCDPQTSWYYLHYGDSKELPEIKGYLFFEDTWRNHGIPLPSEEVTGGRWTSDDPSIVRIDNNKTMTAVGVGDCKLSYKAYIGGKEYEFKPSVHINKLSLGFGYEYIYGNEVECKMPESMQFTGGCLKPDPVLTYKDYTLVEGKDYIIKEYGPNNSCSDAAYVKIEGRGIFNGTGIAYFKITSRDISECTAVSTPVIYNGNQTKPDIKLFYDGNLIDSSEYYVKTSSKIKLGKQQATLRAWDDNLTGEMKVEYEVIPNTMDGITASEIPDMTCTGYELCPHVDLYKDGRKIDYWDYSEEYEDNINAGTATLVISSKKYEGTMRVYFNILPAEFKDLSIELDQDEYCYTGKAIKPEMSVYEGSKCLVEGKDYKVSYKKNVNVGTATVTVTGIGNYAGTAKKKFIIKEEVFDPYWEMRDGSWYYITGRDEYATGIKCIDGIDYLFDDSGRLMTNWTLYNGSWYYSDNEGVLISGWKKISKEWYFFGADHKMCTGLQTIDGKIYYFKAGGAMATGWQKSGDEWYYLASSGEARTGWQRISKVWYYFDKDGRMYTGLNRIDSKFYYFKSSGAMATKWIKLDGNWYYFRSDGSMAVSTNIKISGKLYSFDENGICTNP